jgi:hypothetical protein
MNATAADERMSWRQGAGLRQEIMAEIRKALRWKFHFIDVEEAEVLLVVPIGGAGWVAAIGHPADGSYEWVGRHEPSFVPQLGKEIHAGYEHSDSGYGIWESALRDGLVKMTE